MSRRDITRTCLVQQTTSSLSKYISGGPIDSGQSESQQKSKLLTAIDIINEQQQSLGTTQVDSFDTKTYEGEERIQYNDEIHDQIKQSMEEIYNATTCQCESDLNFDSSFVNCPQEDTLDLLSINTILENQQSIRLGLNRNLCQCDNVCRCENHCVCVSVTSSCGSHRICSSNVQTICTCNTQNLTCSCNQFSCDCVSHYCDCEDHVQPGPSNCDLQIEQTFFPGNYQYTETIQGDSYYYYESGRNDSNSGFQLEQQTIGGDPFISENPPIIVDDHIEIGGSKSPFYNKMYLYYSDDNGLTWTNVHDHISWQEFENTIDIYYDYWEQYDQPGSGCPIYSCSTYCFTDYGKICDIQLLEENKLTIPFSQLMMASFFGDKYTNKLIKMVALDSLDQTQEELFENNYIFVYDELKILSVGIGANSYDSSGQTEMNIYEEDSINNGRIYLKFVHNGKGVKYSVNSSYTFQYKYRIMYQRDGGTWEWLNEDWLFINNPNINYQSFGWGQFSSITPPYDFNVPYRFKIEIQDKVGSSDIMELEPTVYFRD